ncbi:hypothetical protein [Deinococcus sp. UR1]|uniref:hypothetical protein n=1 Tax=Deinococcus sp. UR1 TaxID=1704277 RepID=UPI000C18F9ED|nr:hypothetical protein [Deinococcus sp. UR1]PIG96913.1 hypothetical protein AMD26_015420 [Deinococcus sp. UR1]
MPVKLPQDVQEKLRKLKELAERGIGGEKRAAQAQYDRIMTEFGLHERDFLSTDTHYDTYTVKNKHEITLLLQIYGMVVGISSANYRQENARCIWFQATEDEHARIKATYAAHRAGLAAHLEEAAKAYCVAHDLTAPPSGKTTLTTEEALRIRRMAQAIDTTPGPALPAIRAHALPGGH